MNDPRIQTWVHNDPDIMKRGAERMLTDPNLSAAEKKAHEDIYNAADNQITRNIGQAPIDYSRIVQQFADQNPQQKRIILSIILIFIEWAPKTLIFFLFPKKKWTKYFVIFYSLIFLFAQIMLFLTVPIWLYIFWLPSFICMIIQIIIGTQFWFEGGVLYKKILLAIDFPLVLGKYIFFYVPAIFLYFNKFPGLVTKNWILFK